MNPIPRSLIIYDWTLVIYGLVSILLILVKIKSGYKFLHFTRLIFSDRYIKTYRVDSLFKSFHLLLNVLTVLVFPLLLQVVASKLISGLEILFSEYVKYLFFFSVFYFTKMLVQLSFAKIIGYQEVIRAYVFQKQTYFTYLTFLSLLPILGFVFSPSSGNGWLYLFVILWIVLFLLSILLIFYSFKHVLLNRFLYFILYICTFEISPMLGVIYFIRL